VDRLIFMTFLRNAGDPAFARLPERNLNTNWNNYLINCGDNKGAEALARWKKEYPARSR
jgi:hypothetical protein